jgi:hemerythrin-like domain-containing protein
MTDETLAAALEREHREIDEGVDEFVAGLDAGAVRAEPIARAIVALRRHIYLEEVFLFPPMRSGGLMAAIVVMIREHGRMWRLMDDLAARISVGADPAAIREDCGALIDALKAHNLKEERIIYPEADALLPSETIDELHRFLASGAMPEGWVCRAAAPA